MFEAVVHCPRCTLPATFNHEQRQLGREAIEARLLNKAHPGIDEKVLWTCEACKSKFPAPNSPADHNEAPVLWCSSCAQPQRHAFSHLREMLRDVNDNGPPPPKDEMYKCGACGSLRAFGKRT